MGRPWRPPTAVSRHRVAVRSTSPGGARPTTTYFKNGDVAQVTDTAGLITKFTYDGLGRAVSSSEISDGFPSGVVTTVGYDKLSRVMSQIDPAATDRVTGAKHTPTTTTEYNYDGRHQADGRR